MNTAGNPSATALLSLRITGPEIVDRISERVPMYGDVEVLTRKMAEGDEKAFAVFHDGYFDRLYQFLIVISRGHEDEAQEALQQTFLRVVRYVRPFKCEEAFWCWLKSVARSTARDAGRKQQRYRNLLTRFSLWREVPDGQTCEESLVVALEESLEELSAEDRGLLIKKYVEGSAIKELCSEAGTSQKALESRLLRLRRRVRDMLLEKLQST
jgi:RNA polymerase sigma-70 factor (ECF subfamily)